MAGARVSRRIARELSGDVHRSSALELHVSSSHHSEMHVTEHERWCKRCGAPFKQPAVRGRPWEYCSGTCKAAARNEMCARRKRDRHRTLRAAGVPPAIAASVSTTLVRYEIVMQLAEEGAYAGPDT
jgi:hypothetical protein